MPYYERVFREEHYENFFEEQLEESGSRSKRNVVTFGHYRRKANPPKGQPRPGAPNRGIGTSWEAP